MKNMREVCRIVGVTRRTLQEYDKIDLIKPTSKSYSGYWLYDKEAIQKLILIQVFVEGGYERKAIKSILESPKLDIIQEFDRLINTLEEKRKRINGMIDTVKSMKIVLKLPEATLIALGKTDLTRIYQEKSFSSYLEDSISDTEPYSEADYADAEIYLPFMYNIIAIGCFIGTPIESKRVQAAVDFVFNEFKEAEAVENNPSGDVKLSDTEMVKTFMEDMLLMLADEDIQQIVNLHCGDRSVEYIAQAVKFYCDDIRSKQEGAE